MSLETDLLIDRGRLKRRLLFWRVLTALVVVGCALFVLAPNLRPGRGGHLTRLTVSGLITDDRRLNEAVAALARNEDVRGLIVSIDSPGGSFAGGESLHDAIQQVAARKPVVAVMGGTAASAGYMVALPAARIFARSSTLTGSIGVLLQTGDVSGLLERLGISTEAIISGPLKDQPSYTHPISPRGREVLQALVMDMYDQFVGMVAAGRHMQPDQVRALADGRPYTGRQALDLGLVDAIGGEAEARAWLAAEKGIPVGLPVDELRLGNLARRVLVGSFAPVLDELIKSVLSQGLRLDGAWAIWQPAIGNE
jgi:protease-4